ncbi:MAG: nuclear transport factor 2 family protein [Comamonadaceae bacterium]|nr:nuclear transport factor 2 family protein [Comamonadaceae bacterium]
MLELWTKTYNTEGKPDWSHILPYYDNDIHFRDSIQEIRGIEEFTAMTERLTKRSKDLKMKIVNAVMEGNLYSHGMGNDHSVQEKSELRSLRLQPADPE